MLIFIPNLQSAIENYSFRFERRKGCTIRNYFVDHSNTKIINIENKKGLEPGVDYSLCMDDFLVCYRSKHMCAIEHKLQLCLNRMKRTDL